MVVKQMEMVVQLQFLHLNLLELLHVKPLLALQMYPMRNLNMMKAGLKLKLKMLSQSLILMMNLQIFIKKADLKRLNM